MATIYYNTDTDLSLIRAARVAILGYGSQGHAHAQNLAASGASVRVGLLPDSRRIPAVTAAGLTAGAPGEVSAWADVVMMLVPDAAQPALYEDAVAPNLRIGGTLMFAHGFNIRYGTITPRPDLDVSMIAPKGPGHRVRETFVDGGGVPALVAVHHDASGRALDLALSYACALGATRAGVLATTFAEETETDLFGEQAVLCGGMSALVQAAFDTLVTAGYQPEVAYFECLHELKLIVDLMYRGGLNYMRYSVSDTAEYGDYVSGPRIVDTRVRGVMAKVLDEIRDGTFANKWLAENRAGRKAFEAERKAESLHPIEVVGAELRKMMPFLAPVTVRPGE